MASVSLCWITLTILISFRRTMLIRQVLAFVALCAVGRHTKTASGCAIANMCGTPSILAEYALRASINGLRRCAQRAIAGRPMPIGMPSDETRTSLSLVRIWAVSAFTSAWGLLPAFSQSVQLRCHAQRLRPTSRLPGSYPNDPELDPFRIANLRLAT